jgi:quinol monooxygenase YgiN
MIFEHAQFTIYPGLEVAFEKAYPRIREVLLRAPGCRSAQLHRSADHTNVYLLRVGWDSVAHHTEHFPSTLEGKEVVSAFKPFLAAADVTHFEGQPL